MPPEFCYFGELEQVLQKLQGKRRLTSLVVTVMTARQQSLWQVPGGASWQLEQIEVHVSDNIQVSQRATPRHSTVTGSIYLWFQVRLVDTRSSRSRRE